MRKKAERTVGYSDALAGPEPANGPSVDGPAIRCCCSAPRNMKENILIIFVPCTCFIGKQAQRKEGRVARW